jgi:MFS family permease
MEEFHITITQASGFIGTTVLVLGFANFLWVPLAENYGRRAVFIGSMIATLRSVIWHATTTSYHSYLGSCILDDLGSGPVETLFPMIITDVVSFNERGKFVTLYTTALFLSLVLSPVVCSAMAQNVGWRNFFWLIVSLRLRIRQFWSVGTVLWPSLQFQCVASGLQQVRLLFRCGCGPCNRRAIFRLGINMGHETKRWHSGA